MITFEKVTATAESMHDLEIPDCSLNRRVALGVKGGGNDHLDAWIIFDFSKSAASVAEICQRGPMVDADAELNAALVILAEEEVWIKVGKGGLESVLSAADARQVVVTGKLAYFIRNVRSSVDLMMIFGKHYVDHSY